MNLRSLFAATLLAVLAPAVAQEAPPAATGATVEAAKPVGPAERAREADIVDRTCLQQTGTRIRPPKAKAGRERCPSNVYGRVWTRDDIRSTGQTDVAQALRMLDPSIH